MTDDPFLFVVILSEDPPCFWIHEMNLLASRAQHGLIDVIAVRGAAVREPALNVQSEIGAQEERCRHAIV